MRDWYKQWLRVIFAAAVVAFAGPSCAETLSGTELVKNLQQGGFALLMRHAHAPRTPPETAAADPANRNLERQLDETGRAQARAMGEALRSLRIGIGSVLSSPTFRALETVRYAGFGTATTYSELGDGGRSMASDQAGTRGEWLRSRLTQPPPRGTNTVIVTHQPNITEALGQTWSDLQDGEALVIRPDGANAPAVVARVKIDEWRQFAAG